MQAELQSQKREIDELKDAAVTEKEVTDASAEDLKSQVDSIQMEVDVLAETVASQGRAITEIRAESEPAELKQMYTEYLKAAADDLGTQYRQEQETHAETQRQLQVMTESIANAVRDGTQIPGTISPSKLSSDQTPAN